MFCAPVLVFGGSEGVGSRFPILRSRTHFGITEGVRSRFNVLHARTLFRRFRGRRVPFSYFEVPDSFSAVPRVWVPFSCFALPDSFWAVPRASSPVFMFCAPGLVFDRTDGVGSRFHVLRSRTHVPRNRGCRVPFSFFALPDSFSAVPRVSGPVFMLCAPALIIGGTEGVGSRFNVLRSRTRFGRYRGRRVPFSCLALPDSFLAVRRVSGPIFMFCAPGLFCGGTEGVGYRFLVLRSRTHFRCFRGVESRFHVLRARTRFRRHLGRLVPFSCFALQDSF
jgi:hypothetical protein